MGVQRTIWFYLNSTFNKTQKRYFVIFGGTLVVFRTPRAPSMDKKEEIDWPLSQYPTSSPRSIHNEFPLELIAYKDQVTHLTNAFCALANAHRKRTPGI